MKYVEVVVDAGSADNVSAIAEKHEVADIRRGEAGEDGKLAVRLLVADDKLQTVLDALQKMLHAQATARVVVLPVEIALPKPKKSARKKMRRSRRAKRSMKKSKRMRGWISTLWCWSCCRPSLPPSG